jgi:hypothetical protein
VQLTFATALRKLLFLREILRLIASALVLAGFGVNSAPIVGGSAQITLIW